MDTIIYLCVVALLVAISVVIAYAWRKKYRQKNIYWNLANFGKNVLLCVLGFIVVHIPIFCLLFTTDKENKTGMYLFFLIGLLLGIAAFLRSITLHAYFEENVLVKRSIFSKSKILVCSKTAVGSSDFRCLRIKTGKKKMFFIYWEGLYYLKCDVIKLVVGKDFSRFEDGPYYKVHFKDHSHVKILNGDAEKNEIV